MRSGSSVRVSANAQRCNTMSRLSRAAGVSAIFTLFGTCFYFGFGVLYTIAHGGNAAGFFVQTVIGAIVCWVGLTFILEPIMGGFDEINKPRSRDSDQDPRETGKPGADDTNIRPSQE